VNPAGPPVIVIERLVTGTIVSVGGEIDLFSSPRLDAALQKIALGERVAVDFTHCAYLDSSVFAVLIGALRARGERFAVIVPPDSRLNRIFKLANVSAIMRIVRDRAAAFG
jgi:anti-anti-sigma factor